STNQVFKFIFIFPIVFNPLCLWCFYGLQQNPLFSGFNWQSFMRQKLNHVTLTVDIGLVVETSLRNRRGRRTLDSCACSRALPTSSSNTGSMVTSDTIQQIKQNLFDTINSARLSPRGIPLLYYSQKLTTFRN
ncbi:hypothetical protein L9F63_005990, partial [Diploptera punctata]